MAILPLPLGYAKLSGTLATAGPWQGLFARAGYRVYPYHSGAFSSGSYNNAVSIYGASPLPLFKAGDYFIVCKPTSYGASTIYVPDLTNIQLAGSVDANAINTVAPQVTILTGDYLLNLGADGAANPLAAPNYDGSRLTLLDDPYGLGTLGSYYLSTGRGGFFHGWVKGSPASCDLLITDPSGAPKAVIPSFALTYPQREVTNVKDFGAQGDGETDDRDAIMRAVYAIPAQGGTLFFPPGDYYLQSSVLIDRGNITVEGNGQARLVVDGVAVFCLKFRGDQAPGGRMPNCHVHGMRFYDPDPLNHVSGEESHGVHFNKVDHGSVTHCHFQSIGDEAVDTGQSTHITIAHNYCYDCCAASTVTNAVAGALSLNSCSYSRLESNHVVANNFGTALRVETSTDDIASSYNVIAKNIIDSPGDARNLWAGVGWNGMGCGIGVLIGSFGNAYNLVITENIIRNALRSGIVVNGSDTKNIAGLVISNNIIEGGGNADIRASEVGAITIKGLANNAVISGNVIRDWGTDAATLQTNSGGVPTVGAGTHWAIFTNRDRFIIANNQIINAPGGIFNNAAASYEAGNLIQGNRLSGLYKAADTVVGIRGSGRDMIQGNSLDDFSCDVGEFCYGVDTVATGGGVAPQCLVLGNRVYDLGSTGTRVLYRIQNHSVAAFNWGDGAASGLGMALVGDNATNAIPVAFGNMLTNCTTLTDKSPSGSFVKVMHPFGNGASGEYITDASGTATITDASNLTYVVVTHGVKEVDIADIQVTPTTTLGSAASFFISNVGATTFRINVNVDPAADVSFVWSIIKRAKIAGV